MAQQITYVKGPCMVCGRTDYPLSMGGPDICPACDCGIDEIERLQSEVNLRTEIKHLKLLLKSAADTLEDWVSALPQNVATEDKALIAQLRKAAQ